ncbi:hypothetical protein WG899_00305 [Paucibacter sp. AS339]|uniref:hypothetical protein n=1 Tax=Paucibacter hankyongi TaxID=3133434 RepID=UPI003094D8C5
MARATAAFAAKTSDVSIELARSTNEEMQSQLYQLRDFHAARRTGSGALLARLQQAVMANNIFEVLMDAVQVCSLGQITSALFEVGGQYRRSM